MGKTYFSVLAALSVATGQNSQQSLGPGGLWLISPSCRPGRQAFPGHVLVSIHRTLPGGVRHLYLRGRLQSRPGKGAVCQASALC